MHDLDTYNICLKSMLPEFVHSKVRRGRDLVFLANVALHNTDLHSVTPLPQSYPLEHISNLKPYNL